MEDTWAEGLKESLGGAITSLRQSAPGEWEFSTSAQSAKQVLQELRNAKYGFTHLQDLTSYDDSPKTPRYRVVYVLESMLHKKRCLVVSDCEESGGVARVPTVTDLWAGANWLEREVYDLMGIEFTGHPDPRRILLPSDFQGHPLRKDFILDYRQTFPKTSEVGNVGDDPFAGQVREVKG